MTVPPSRKAEEKPWRYAFPPSSHLSKGAHCADESPQLVHLGIEHAGQRGKDVGGIRRDTGKQGEMPALHRQQGRFEGSVEDRLSQGLTVSCPYSDKDRRLPYLGCETAMFGVGKRERYRKGYAEDSARVTVSQSCVYTLFTAKRKKQT